MKSQEQVSTTKMVQSDERKSTLVKEAQAPAEGPKMVKIQAITPLAIRRDGKLERIVAGSVVDVTPEEANMLCKPVTGFYAFSGERYGDEANVKHKHVRAKLVQDSAFA